MPPTPMAADGAAVAGAARGVAFLLLVLLIVLCLAWELWLAPTGRGTLAVKALPLAAWLPGVRRGALQRLRSLSLLVWLYVAEGLVRAVTEGGTARALAVAEVALGIALFAACVAAIRGRGRARRQSTA